MSIPREELLDHLDHVELPTPPELEETPAVYLREGHRVLFKGELRTIVRWHHLPPSHTNPAGAVALDFATGADGQARTGLFRPATILKAIV